MDPVSKPAPFWWPSTQTVIAIILTISMVAVTFTLIVIKEPPASDMVKMLVGGLMTVGFSSIISFYFGSSAGSKDKDNAIIGQMAPAKNPPNPPAEAIADVAPIHWWDVLTDRERVAITGAAPTDARVNAFMVAAQTGRATSNDLAYLVTKNLLTHDRAAEIQAA